MKKGIVNEDNDSLDCDIIQTGVADPGINLMDISRKLGKPWGTIRYRLFELERSGLIRLERKHHSLKLYPISDQSHEPNDEVNIE